MWFIAIQVVCLGFLTNLSRAQGSQDTQNPFTVPACSTMFSIVESCESKLIDANTITASVYSCLCFDGSGNYLPAAYDNAVAGCSSAFPNESTDFDFWLPGFCTNFATGTAAESSTTSSASAPAVVLTSTPTVTTSGGAGLSSTPAPNPGGFISTTTSNSTSLTSVTTSTSAGTLSNVSSTSSKAEGVKIRYISGDASFLSILGSILGAFLIL